MARGTRANGETNNDSTPEGGEWREMMQKLITEIVVLNGEVASLKKLDQTVMELKEQLGEIRGDNTPGEKKLGHREADKQENGSLLMRNQGRGIL